MTTIHARSTAQIEKEKQVQAEPPVDVAKDRGSGWLVRGDAAASVLDAAEFAQRQKVARRCLGRLRQWNLNPGPLALLP